MTTKNTSFIVRGIKTGTGTACEKETQVLNVVFREQAMKLCPRDFLYAVDDRWDGRRYVARPPRGGAGAAVVKVSVSVSMGCSVPGATTCWV